MSTAQRLNIAELQNQLKNLERKLDNLLAKIIVKYEFILTISKRDEMVILHKSIKRPLLPIVDTITLKEGHYKIERIMVDTEENSFIVELETIKIHRDNYESERKAYNDIKTLHREAKWHE